MAKQRIRNDVYEEYYNDESRYYYCIGGRWSAKTYEAIQDIVDRLLVFGGKAAMMRKVYGSIKDTLYADTIKYLKEHGIEYTKTVSPLHITVDGKDIIFKGADDPEKLKGLSDVSYVLLDEVNEFSEMDIETIDQSIRGPGYQALYMCHNPVPKVPGSQYWFERWFKVNKTAGSVKRYYDNSLGAYVSTLKTTYRDNAFCPDHVERRLEGYKETNPSLYLLWTLGEYAEIQGAVFKNYEVVDHVPEGLDPPGYGIDFGFSNDPATLVRIWHNSTDIYIQGLIYSTSLTNKEFYDIIVSKGVSNYDEIIADSAEPKSIKDLYNYGLLNIAGAKKRGYYKEETVQILQAYKIHLLDGDTDLQREFSTYSWKRDKTGRQIPKLQDGNDHYIDAAIMYCHEKLGVGSSVVY